MATILMYTKSKDTLWSPCGVENDPLWGRKRLRMGSKTTPMESKTTPCGVEIDPLWVENESLWDRKRPTVRSFNASYRPVTCSNVLVTSFH